MQSKTGGKSAGRVQSVALKLIVDREREIEQFKEEIIKEDIEEAIRLIKVATQQAATDPMTGVIDMDLIQTGVSANTRQNLSKLVDIIKSILRDNEDIARKGVKLNTIGDETKRRINTFLKHYQNW